VFSFAWIEVVSMLKRVAWHSDQGRSDFETGGATTLRRGFQNCENEEMDRKMPFLSELSLYNHRNRLSTAQTQ
jgi:hypothetical protein